MEDYRVVAERVAGDIAAGRLRAGDRLPPQREFARQQGIAASTAARVYGELVRRGLVVGEVGRGTFVRGGGTSESRNAPSRRTPTNGRIDLELNFPVLPEQGEMLARGLSGLLRPDALTAALQPAGPAGTPEVREAAARLLARTRWRPDPDGILIAGSGRQALAAVMSALVPSGERLGVESMTYPVVKSIARRLGIVLVPLRMDEHGVTPEAVRQAGDLRAVYLQPNLHNPLGITMPLQRRSELLYVLAQRDLIAIEDTVNGFLSTGSYGVPGRSDDAVGENHGSGSYGVPVWSDEAVGEDRGAGNGGVPGWPDGAGGGARRGDGDVVALVGEAGERVVLVDSLSKRIGPGLTLGFVVPPKALGERIGAALRSGGWTAGRFALDAATRWITDGTAEEIQERKRLDAIERQHLAAQRLDGFTIQADPRAYHLWWTLPEPWRAETFVAAAARQGIAVTPAAAFTVGDTQTPNAVRLALASPPKEVLAEALDVLAGLANSTPENTGVE